MSVHRIRLIGPWDYVWLEAADPTMDAPAATAGTIKMPCDWESIFGPRAGRATFSRRFHRPTNLDPHEKVFIVLTGVGGAGRLSLNGLAMGEFDGKAKSAEVEVTDNLESFNQLEVTVDFAPDDTSLGGLYDAVALEIRQD